VRPTVRTHRLACPNSCRGSGATTPRAVASESRRAVGDSARKRGIADEDIVHAVEHALAVDEQDDGRVLYLGPDRAANLLEVVSVMREDGSEIVIHAMRMRTDYEPFLRGEGESNA
jgi:hypothetical protein